MKFKKVLSFFALASILLSISLYFYFINGIKNKDSVEVSQVTNLNETVPENDLTKEEVEVSREKVKRTEQNDFQKLNIFLQVLDKEYKIAMREGQTVYAAMEQLSIDDETFKFKYTENPGLGKFIYEINGIKNSAGNYWIYYVNGKEAPVGVSNYILKEGDIINWKQE